MMHSLASFVLVHGPEVHVVRLSLSWRNTESTEEKKKSEKNSERRNRKGNK